MRLHCLVFASFWIIESQKPPENDRGFALPLPAASRWIGESSLSTAPAQTQTTAEKTFASGAAAALIAFGGSSLGFAVSALTIYKHLLHYNIPKLQRSIIRIIFITPIYSVFSLLSLLVSKWFLYFDAIRDIWEAVVIYCFTTLILDYCGGENACSQAIQANPGTLRHPWPFSLCIRKNWGFIRKEIRCNPQFVKACKRCTLQFVVIKPIMAILSMVLYFARVYEARPWLVFEGVVYNVSYTVALYALVLFYMATRHQPAMRSTNALRKFAAVKLIVFATYWQGLTISLIPHLSLGQARDWGNFILCIEMPIMAAIQMWAFPTSEFCDGQTVTSTAIPTLSLPSEDDLEAVAPHASWMDSDSPHTLPVREGDDDISMSFPEYSKASIATPQPPSGELVDMEGEAEPAPIQPVIGHRDDETSPRSESDANVHPPPPPPLQPAGFEMQSDGSNERLADAQISDSPSAELRASPAFMQQLLAAPERWQKRISQQISVVTDRERQKTALQNVKHVVNVGDVMEDAYHSFNWKYKKHSRLGDNVELDQAEEPPCADNPSLMDDDEFSDDATSRSSKRPFPSFFASSGQNDTRSSKGLSSPGRTRAQSLDRNHEVEIEMTRRDDATFGQALRRAVGAAGAAGRRVAEGLGRSSSQKTWEGPRREAETAEDMATPSSELEAADVPVPPDETTPLDPLKPGEEAVVAATTVEESIERKRAAEFGTFSDSEGEDNGG